MRSSKAGRALDIVVLYAGMFAMVVMVIGVVAVQAVVVSVAWFFWAVGSVVILTIAGAIAVGTYLLNALANPCGRRVRPRRSAGQPLHRCHGYSGRLPG